MSFLNSKCFTDEFNEVPIQYTASRFPVGNFESGINFCLNLDAIPIKLNSEEEHNIALDLISRIPADPEAENGFNRFFIGLQDLDLVAEEDSTDTSRFKWFDNDPLDFGSETGVFPWNNLEPNNFESNIFGVEGCVEMGVDALGRWNDQQCSQNNRILCQRLCSSDEFDPSLLKLFIIAGSISGGFCLMFLLILTRIQIKRSNIKKKKSKRILESKDDIDIEIVPSQPNVVVGTNRHASAQIPTFQEKRKPLPSGFSTTTAWTTNLSHYGNRQGGYPEF